MQSRPTWLIANWKMNGTRAAVLDYAYGVNAALEMAAAGLECVFCPPHPYLDAARHGLPQNTRLELGAQNCAAEKEGAFTGEVGAAMLKDVGCGYVILGHSERRAMGETDQAVAAKAKAALAAGLAPVICIGESGEDYKKKRTAAVLETQLTAIKKLPAGGYLIAYEPIWAIGSGKTPETGEIAAAHARIKTALGSETPVLYGGSVNPANLSEILDIQGVDGALIGGASLHMGKMKSMIGIASDMIKGK